MTSQTTDVVLSATPPASLGTADDTDAFARRDRFVRVSAAVIFLIFFQTYMVAPLIPFLSHALGASEQRVGLLVPAYTLPYAFAALALGGLADRLGRRGTLMASLVGFPLLSLLQAAAPSLNWLLGLRALAGVCNVGAVVMVITLIGDLYPYTHRGRPLGWAFGAIAGGGAAGSTLAGLLAPVIGWRGLFVVTAVAGGALIVPMARMWDLLDVERPAGAAPTSFRTVLHDFAAILRNPRAAKTFAMITLNGMFHSGVFTWLGVHLHSRYGLGEAAIGLALLGYGVPGFVLGPAIGKLVDRYGRRHLIPLGFAVSALAALMFVPHFPLALAILAAPILSLGFDLSHPLMAGIASSLDDHRRGQAMGLNAFAIFFGFGTGSLIFGALATRGTGPAFMTFAAFQLALSAVAVVAFRRE